MVISVFPTNFKLRHPWGEVVRSMKPRRSPGSRAKHFFVIKVLLRRFKVRKQLNFTFDAFKSIRSVPKVSKLLADSAERISAAETCAQFRHITTMIGKARHRQKKILGHLEQWYNNHFESDLCDRSKKHTSH